MPSTALHAPTTASPELTAQLLAISEGALLAAIQRHRLECLLHGDPLVGALLPKLAETLKALARAETMAAMALASLTREVAALFARASIPMLVIKGIPLSLQTTGSLTARGRGDLDLLVDPQRVGDAIELLHDAGFSCTDGATCVGDASLQGHYARFTSIELCLVRSRANHRQWIDLHWHPSHARGILPRFPQLWDQRENCFINSQQVSSLPQSSAFMHSCCHAMADNWMCLRNLVDVDRLSRLLSPEERANTSRMRSVRKTCSVAHDLSRSADLEQLSQKASATQKRKALHDSHKAQLMPWRAMGPDGWTKRSRIASFSRQINLSRHPSHLLSIVLQELIPPSSLVDGQSGSTDQPST